MDTLAELAAAEVGLVDRWRFLDILAEYNKSVRLGKWDPAVDGLSTHGLRALPIDRARFLAVRVTSGITFTLGGL